MKNKKKWIVRGIMTWIIIDKVILFKAWQETMKELEKTHDDYMSQMQKNSDLFKLNLALINKMHPSERQKFLTDLTFIHLTKDL